MMSLRGGAGVQPHPRVSAGQGRDHRPFGHCCYYGHYCSYPEHLGSGGGRSPPAGGGSACTWACAPWRCPEQSASSCRAVGPRPCGPARCGGLPRLQRARPEPRWSFSDWDRALCL